MIGRVVGRVSAVPRQLLSYGNLRHGRFRGVQLQSSRSINVTKETPAISNDLELTPEAVKSAFQPELAALNTHCALLNQTTPSQLLALADVAPIMQIYSTLVANNTAHLAARRVSKALWQTAKDSTLALRSMPQSQRAELRLNFFTQLTDALEEVSNSIIQSTNVDIEALSNVFKAFEIVNAYAGVRLFRSMPAALQPLCGTAVIPCMVKSRQPFAEVRGAFEKDLNPGPRGAATMAWACLRYGEVDAALVLFDQVIASNRQSGSVYTYLLDAFIGDAPPDVALDIFRKYTSHDPHHASMTRMLTRLWAQNGRIPEQISVFREYLERVPIPSELGIKTVATAVVSNVISGSATPDEALDHVLQLCRIYDAYVQRHTVFLNVILTEISNKWCTKRDEARDLILAVIANYGSLDEDSVVSFRVRLNAMEMLNDTEPTIEELWSARKSAPQLPPLEKWDWLALARATNASDWFVHEWARAGSPFSNDIRRFCASRGYRIGKRH